MTQPTGDSANDLSKLIIALRDPKMSVWNAAASAIGRLGSAASPAIPAIIEQLDSEDENKRGYMAYLLGGFGQIAESGVPKLIELLDDECKTWFQEKRSYPVRFRAAIALAKINPDCEEMISVLRDAMKYRELEYVQAEACELIATLGSRASPFLPDLKAAENDPSPTHRARVRRTLAYLDPNHVNAD